LLLSLARAALYTRLGRLPEALWDAQQAVAAVPASYAALTPAARVAGTAPAVPAAGGSSSDNNNDGVEVVDMAALHAKALYRRAVVQCELADAAMAAEREVPRRYWDMDKVRQLLRSVEADLDQAAAILTATGLPPDDGGVQRTRARAAQLRQLLTRYEAAARAQERAALGGKLLQPPRSGSKDDALDQPALAAPGAPPPPSTEAYDPATDVLPPLE
jgi:hypothetical protein